MEENVVDPWWVHTFSITAGILSDSTDFIKKIFDMAEVDQLDRMKVVAECLKMDPVVDAEIRRQCVATILDWFHNGGQRERNAAVDMLVGLDDAWVAPVVRQSLAGSLSDRYVAKLLKRP